MALERLPLLFSTPRTGSTAIAAVMAHYLKERHGVEPLKEAFALESVSLWDNGSGISQSSQRPELVVRSHAEPEDAKWDAIRLERLELVKKYRTRYFFKLLSSQVLNLDFKEFVENYDIVLLERRHLFNQLLSYLISMCTNVWYSEQEQFIKERTLTAQRAAFELFEHAIFSYRKLKKTLPSTTPMLYYEDFREHGPKWVLDKLGWTEHVDLSSLHLTPIQNKRAKLEAFTNPDDIKSWYQASRLNDFWPIS